MHAKKSGQFWCHKNIIFALCLSLIPTVFVSSVMAVPTREYANIGVGTTITLNLEQALEEGFSGSHDQLELRCISGADCFTLYKDKACKSTLTLPFTWDLDGKAPEEQDTLYLKAQSSSLFQGIILELITGGARGPEHSATVIHRYIFTAFSADLQLLSTYVVPGHENTLTYKIKPGRLEVESANLQIFQRNARGDAKGDPLYSEPIEKSLISTGTQRSFVYSGGELAGKSGNYLFVLETRLPDGSTFRTAVPFDVRAWGIFLCFTDRLTEDEKAQMDRQLAKIPKKPSLSAMLDPSLPFDAPAFNHDTFEYVAGVDETTITSETLSISIWYWDEEEVHAKDLRLKQVIPINDFKVWPAAWNERQYYEDRGSVIVQTDGIIYSMTNPNQFYSMRVQVAPQGVRDKVGNGFDYTEDLPGRQGEMFCRKRVDGDGKTEWLEVQYR